MRLGASLSLALALGVLSGCGSAAVDELPPAAAPPRSPPLARPPAGTIGPARVGADDGPRRVAHLDGGRRLAVVRGRERVLEVRSPGAARGVVRAPAGVGPTQVACLDRGPCYVADTRGDAVLVFAVGDAVALTRRYRLDGGPYALALDRARRRLFVTLPGRNELVELIAHGRPHVLRRWPTVRQPDAVAVDARTGTVTVTGGDGRVLEHVEP